MCDWVLRAAGGMMTVKLDMASLKTLHQFADSALFGYGKADFQV